MEEKQPEQKRKIFSPEKAEKLIRGEITLAQYVGLSKQTLYRIATVGHQMLKMGKYDSALEIFQGLVAASPYDSVFQVHLGATLANLERFDEAMAAYSKAIDFNIANVDALASRGELYLRRQEIAPAIKDLEAAVKADAEGKHPAGQRARALLTLLQRSMQQGAVPGGPGAPAASQTPPAAAAKAPAPAAAKATAPAPVAAKPAAPPAPAAAPAAKAGSDSFGSGRSRTSEWAMPKNAPAPASAAEKKPEKKPAESKPKAKK